MSKKHLSFFLVLLFFANIFLPFSHSLAAPDEAEVQRQITEKQAELDAINQKLESKSAIREAAKRRANTAYGKLVEVDAELQIEEDKVNAIIASIHATQELIEARMDSIAVAQKRLDKQTEIYGKRLRDIYKNGHINYIDVLFGSKDFSDFATRLELLKRIIKQDVGIIAKIKEERENLLSEKAKLEDEKSQLQKRRAALEPQRQIVLAKRQERAQKYEVALGEKERLDREYNELLAMSQEISNIIKRFQSKGISGSGSGSMMWPIQGEITSEYGWRTHPIFGDARYHSGIDIGADYDDPVAAADSGVVVHAGWLGGYGYAVILDHGQGLQTLYGHNNSLNVSEGQNVAKGQTVAFAGATGYATGPHVHFEVRLNGEVTNPRNYLP